MNKEMLGSHAPRYTVLPISWEFIANLSSKDNCNNNNIIKCLSCKYLLVSGITIKPTC